MRRGVRQKIRVIAFSAGDGHGVSQRCTHEDRIVGNTTIIQQCSPSRLGDDDSHTTLNGGREEHEDEIESCDSSVDLLASPEP